AGPRPRRDPRGRSSSSAARWAGVRRRPPLASTARRSAAPLRARAALRHRHQAALQLLDGGGEELDLAAGGLAPYEQAPQIGEDPVRLLGVEEARVEEQLPGERREAIHRLPRGHLGALARRALPLPREVELVAEDRRRLGEVDRGLRLARVAPADGVAAREVAI